MGLYCGIVAVESTFNWYWLVDGLMDAGFAVRLVNTTAVQQYSGLKHSDDSHDAFWLAHLMRLGILPTGYIYPKGQRGVRVLTEVTGSLEGAAISSGVCADEQRFVAGTIRGRTRSV
jgi:transposase